MSLITIVSKRYDPLDELRSRRYKYLYNLCRLYYSNNDKQIKYCITNIYSVTGHVDKNGLSGRYPSYRDIRLALIGMDEEELSITINDFKDVLDYNSNNFYTYATDNLTKFMDDVTRFVAEELSSNGRLAFNSFAYYINDILKKYKMLDKSNDSTNT